MDKRVVTVLGATGSVGRSALDVIARHREDYRVFALTAYGNVKLLIEQCACFQPDYAVVADDTQLEEAGELLHGLKTRVLAGADALRQVASDERCNTVLAAIAGAIGLAPTLAAVRAGKRVLLANKEALIMAGSLMMREARTSGAVLLPLDSEHSGIFQCLNGLPEGRSSAYPEKVILTASGGPFLNTPRAALSSVTPQQACAHPNWDMGAKISVDSATMMNKGLEVIEACCLFDLSPDQVEVIVHPQSVVHAMVSFKDGSVLAQMGCPDMRTPIACALAWPERIESGVGGLALEQLGELQFQAVDEEQFPCLPLALQALRTGAAAVIALNAANEVAVEAFLAGGLRFDRIIDVVRVVVESSGGSTVDTLDAAIRIDAEARTQAREWLGRCPADSSNMKASAGT